MQWLEEESHRCLVREFVEVGSQHLKVDAKYDKCYENVAWSMAGRLGEDMCTCAQKFRKKVIFFCNKHVVCKPI